MAVWEAWEGEVKVGAADRGLSHVCARIPFLSKPNLPIFCLRELCSPAVRPFQRTDPLERPVKQHSHTSRPAKQHKRAPKSSKAALQGSKTALPTPPCLFHHFGGITCVWALCFFSEQASAPNSYRVSLTSLALQPLCQQLPAAPTPSTKEII